MKKLILAMALVCAASSTFAGGLSEPAMDPAVVAAETASSGGDNWVGVVMTVLLFGAALSN